ncbi:MAG: hypothetical protein R6U38_15695 [Desulfatiglandaceae bacterium]
MRDFLITGKDQTFRAKVAGFLADVLGSSTSRIEDHQDWGAVFLNELPRNASGKVLRHVLVSDHADFYQEVPADSRMVHSLRPG